MNAGDAIGRDAVDERAVERVLEHELSTPFDELVAEYEALVDDRDRFLWKWLDLLVPETTLSCVDPDRRDLAVTAKLVASMFVVLLDDLAERHRDRSTFERAARIPFRGDAAPPTGDPHVDPTHLAFAERVWTRFEDAIADAPRADEFGDVLSFDLAQTVNAIAYAWLANDCPELVTLREATRHGEHNMMLYAHADVDLAFSPAFDRGELADLRRVVAEAQAMTRIGNWVATWEREVAEGDFSSGVIAYALEEGIVSPGDLRAVRADDGDRDGQWLIETVRSHGLERRFVGRYLAVRGAASSYDAELATVDVADYLDGVEQVMGYYLDDDRRL